MSGVFFRCLSGGVGRGEGGVGNDKKKSPVNDNNSVESDA